MSDMWLNGHGLEHRVGDRAYAHWDAQSPPARESNNTYVSSRMNKDLNEIGVLDIARFSGIHSDPGTVKSGHGKFAFHMPLLASGTLHWHVAYTKH
jgi:hypothetical protein